MAITHTFPDGTVWEFVTETAKRMCVLEGRFGGACEDIVCQWCKHMKIKPSAGFCEKFKDKPNDVYFYSAPCEKFEDNGSGKCFSRDVLAEDLPQDAEIRKALIERLRKDFGNEVAIVGNQAIHVGRMGVYAANVYAEPARLLLPAHECLDSGNLGEHALDAIANASPLLRDAWNAYGPHELWALAKDGGLEEFKLMPFICYAPSVVRPRAKCVALGRRMGTRVHWALVSPAENHLLAEYAGSTAAIGG